MDLLFDKQKERLQEYEDSLTPEEKELLAFKRSLKGKRSAVIKALTEEYISRKNAEAQKKAAELEYQQYLKQIEEQRRANSEQQAYNKSEAELAFSRQSSKGQLAQLVDAGLSEQQARAIIAAGSAGGYTAAPSVNSMQGVDYSSLASAQSKGIQADADNLNAQAQMQATAASSQWYTQILDFFNDLPGNVLNLGFRVSEALINDSLFNETGGYIGNLATGSLQGQVLRHINEIPQESRTFSGFTAFASSAAAPAWCKTAEMQQAIQSASSSPMARRAANHFFSTANEFLTGDMKMQNEITEMQMKSAQNKIMSFKVDEEAMTRDLQDIEQDYKISILPDRYAAMMNSYQEECARMAADRDLWQNEQYKKKYIESKLKNVEDAALMAKIMTLKHQGAFDHIKDHPELAQMFGIYQMWSDVGMTDSLFGEIVSSIDAVGSSTLGFGVADILSSVKEWIDSRKDKKGLLR